jgi:hypothetical protein
MMDPSRRAFVISVAAIGGSCAAAKPLALAATTEIPSNPGPVFDEQPPTTSTFTIGVPVSILYGKARHPNAHALAVGLESLPLGFTTTLVAGQIMLHWDGAGSVGTYQVRAFLDDGN